MDSITMIQTSKVAAAIGPYSQAVMVNGLVFVSGQIPVSPETGKLIGSSIEEQTNCVLSNIENILLAANLTLKNIVKVEIYLKNLDDFAVVNEIYATKFNHAIKPARQTLQVSKLPLDALIEISCIAAQNI